MNQNKEFNSYLNRDINPKEDFYGYANGGWQKSNPLKGEYASYGVFNIIDESARLRVKELIETLDENPESKIPDTIEQKINDIYRLGMDISRRDQEGVTPIKSLLAKVEDLTEENLQDFFNWYRKELNGGFFSMGVGSDPANSNMNILHIGETGLLLGDRDYYLETNDNNKKILNGLNEYIVTILQLAGYSLDRAESVWKDVIEIETKIAENKKTREERRNPMLSHNWMTVGQVDEKYPKLDIKLHLKALNIEDIDGLNVASIKFFDFLNTYLPTLSVDKIRSYFLVEIIASATGTLSEDFYDADFQLYGRIMSGTEEKRPLWKRVMSIPNSMFGEAVGQIYVKKYFPESNKLYMKRLVENLRNALGEHIDSLEWMSYNTKRKAHEKLAAMNVKIGYPDKWKDYSGIHIDPKLSYNENIRIATKWVIDDELSKIGKPVDKDEWFMTPQTVNAYYSPMNNEICFPAGILQSPFFDINVDDEINYGGIGVVIGHEMTHGFDDQGRQFDKDGNLKNWWSENDINNFNELAEKLVQQFNAVEVAPGVYANGIYTLGENIADQGGLRIALSAYINSQKDHPDFNPNHVDDSGFSHLQKFYLSYAHIWANNIRSEEILKRTKSDPHSLSVNRVNVTLKNIQPFMTAFDIKEGDNMFRPENERVVIW